MIEEKLSEKEKKELEKAKQEIEEIDKGLLIIIKASLFGVMILILYSILLGFGVFN